MRMTCALLLGALAIAMPPAQSSGQAHPASDRERLTGAWRLVSIGEVAPDGSLHAVSGVKGSLIYTAGGQMSVQLIYDDTAVTNDYVSNGYEASFGSYDVDEASHTVTHHVQSSITRGLIGKNLTRAYRLEGRRLIIRSTRPDEHWQVTWEHD